MNYPTETGDFIKKQGVDTYPQFTPLCLFLKCFLQQRKLSETFTGGVGSYLLSVMVLIFLKVHYLTQNEDGWKGLGLGHLMYEFFRWSVTS